MVYIYTQEDIQEHGTDYQFIVRSIQGSLVAFESAVFPNNFITIGKNGVAVLERQELKSYFIHFTVYARVCDDTHIC